MIHQCRPHLIRDQSTATAIQPRPHHLLMTLQRQQRLDRTLPNLHLLIAMCLGESAIRDVGLRVLRHRREGQGIGGIAQDGGAGRRRGHGAALGVREVYSAITGESRFVQRRGRRLVSFRAGGGGRIQCAQANRRWS